MSTILAMVVWILTYAGAVDYDCYDQLVGPQTHLAEPPPPPSSDATDGECPIISDRGSSVRRNISNGF